MEILLFLCLFRWSYSLNWLENETGNHWEKNKLFLNDFDKTFYQSIETEKLIIHITVSALYKIMKNHTIKHY